MTGEGLELLDPEVPTLPGGLVPTAQPSVLVLSTLDPLNFFFSPPYIHSFIHLFIYLFIYLFIAVLGLCCCAQSFSSCGERGLLFVAVRGLLIAVASLVAEHGL